MVDDLIHGSKADLWNLGVLCYELLFGTVPFSGPGGCKETAIINNTITTITNVNYPNDIFQFTEEVSQYSNDVEMQDATNLQSTPSPPIPNNKFNKKPMK
nr:12177_t:CDS:2 [Entrophospora candida]